MADFSALKTAIQNYIKQNGNEEITGEILQTILLSIVTTLGDSAIDDLITALDNEVAARQNADSSLEGAINQEGTLRSNADSTLQGNINAEATARENADAALQAAINLINSYIPSQTSSSNKLADKAFVNSSIATATATFRGSYNVVSDLSLSYNATHAQIQTALATKMSALSITPDNNDYAFVQIPTADATPTQIAKVEKYKYNGTAWAFEYELNNSGFTSAQWAAINSGATLELIGKLSALPTNAELTELLAAKQDVIQDLATIRSGASAGATAVQPATLNSALSNTVAESGVFDLSAYNDGTTYADLNAALTALNALPSDFKKGGMSMKFVLTSDNEYVQFRLMLSTFTDAQFTNTANWQGVDDEPTVGSHNLVESGGVYNIKTELNKLGIFATPNNSYPSKIWEILEEQDLLFDNNTEEYTQGILDTDGTIILPLLNGRVSDFIEVTQDMVILCRNAFNLDNHRPIIVGYDKDKNVVKTIATGTQSNVGLIQSTYEKDNNILIHGEFYFVSASEFKYIRLATTETSNFDFYKISLEKAFNCIDVAERLKNGYYDYFSSKKVQKKGDKYIPVYAGMTIITNARGEVLYNGISLYDSNKVFIKRLDKAYNHPYDIFCYTFTEDDINDGISYLVASSFYTLKFKDAYDRHLFESFFYIVSQNDIYDILASENLVNSLFNKDFFESSIIRCPCVTEKSNITTTVSRGATATENSFEFINAAVVAFKGNTPKKLVFKDFVYTYIYSIEVEGLTNETTLTISEVSLRTHNIKITQDGQYLFITQYNDNNYLEYLLSNTLSSGVNITCNNILAVQIRADVLNNSGLFKYIENNLEELYDGLKNDKLLYKRPLISKFAVEAERSYEMETNSNVIGKKYVPFGTSITLGYIRYIANYLNLELFNLAKAGSCCDSTGSMINSLSQEYLEQIPEDAVLCTICYGANRWVHSDDIDNRDENNSIGTINKAIDYIQANRPACAIILGADIGGPTGQPHTDIKAIAERRHILFADTSYIEGPFVYNATTNTYSWVRQRNTPISIDGVHLTDLGYTRMASAFLNEITKVICKGVNKGLSNHN